MEDILQPMKNGQKINLRVDIDIAPVEDYYSLQATLHLPQNLLQQHISKKFLIFVLEIRSGMNEDSIKMLRNSLMDICQELINLNPIAIGFIINGEYHTSRKPSYNMIKDLLNTVLTVSKQENYLMTLRKLRHTLVDERKRLQNAQLELILFTSYLQIDNSLGEKKKQYIDRLNEHCDQCTQEIEKISKTIQKQCLNSNVYGVSLNKHTIEEYSRADIDLIDSMVVKLGKNIKSIEHAYSFNGAIEAFKKILNFMSQMCQCVKQLFWKTNKPTIYKTGIIIVKKNELNLKDIFSFQSDKNHLTLNSRYIEHQPKKMDKIISILYIFKLKDIASTLMKEIAKTKRIYDGNNKSHVQLAYDQQTLLQMRWQMLQLDQDGKQLYKRIWDYKPSEKRIMFESYSQFKTILDTTQLVLAKVLMKTLDRGQIQQLSSAMMLWSIKRSLAVKLAKRLNANPNMMEEIEQKIINFNKDLNFVDLQAQNTKVKSMVGNCIKTDCNFVGALKNEDCLAVLFELERPESAIADPGRLRIRQVSPFVIRVSTFFQMYYYKITNDKRNVGGQNKIRQIADLDKKNYQQMWDYWDRVEKTESDLGLMPLFVCQENWKVARLLMKPCLGWTACKEPLGYCFAQFQIVPFMVLSAFIRKCQQLRYQIEEGKQRAINSQKQHQMYQQEHQINIIKDKLRRYQDLQVICQETCKRIIVDLSQQKYEKKMIDEVIEKYQNYNRPIQRTVDIIPNNSSFISQIYCAIKVELMPKPNQEEFHQFFKRLVEEELRRQTDTINWIEEESQDKFIDKLLNCKVNQMYIPEYIVQSKYFDNFMQLKKGCLIEKTRIQIERAELACNIKKDNAFNETQRMQIIEYKRLYENRVLWLWYIRFKLYKQIERIKIHKWRSLDITNSYMLLTMIIQNKKQRKNSKRREAIKRMEYRDPFKYQQARVYLEGEFIRVRSKKQAQNVNVLKNKQYTQASTLFCRTQSLEQAAGTLINMSVGNRQIRRYYSQLFNKNTVRVQNKINILLTGQFQGVQVFPGWKISKKKTNALAKEYPHVFRNYRYML